MSSSACFLIADTRRERFPLVAAQWAMLRAMQCWRLDLAAGDFPAARFRTAGAAGAVVSRADLTGRRRVARCEERGVAGGIALCQGRLSGRCNLFALTIWFGHLHDFPAPSRRRLPDRQSRLAPQSAAQRGGVHASGIARRAGQRFVGEGVGLRAARRFRLSSRYDAGRELRSMTCCPTQCQAARKRRSRGVWPTPRRDVPSSARWRRSIMRRSARARGWGLTTCCSTTVRATSTI